MGVTDANLSGYDGMLFVFDADSTGGFWMKNTLDPAVDRLRRRRRRAWCRPPTWCRARRARPTARPTTPGAPYRYAVEVPSGAGSADARPRPTARRSSPSACALRRRRADEPRRHRSAGRCHTPSA